MTSKIERATSVVERSIETIRQAYQRAEDAINAAPAGREAFDLASELRDALDAIQGEAAELRGHTARRIWEAEKLSLAGLADRVGVSKPRAAQFVNAGRREASTNKEGS